VTVPATVRHGEGLQHGPGDVLDLVAAGVSPHTRRSYARAWSAWLAFVGDQDQARAPSAELVAAWLASLHGQGLRPSTIRLRLAGLSSLLQARGLPSPRGSPLVRATLRGICRVQGTATEGRRALDLVDLVAGLPRGQGPIDVRDRALLLVGWAGALRRSELVGLRRSELVEEGPGLRLLLARSKGDPLGAGVQVAIPRGQVAERCPVAAALAWLDLVEQLDQDPAGPWLRSVSRHGAIGVGQLDPGAVGAAVRRCAVRAGLDPHGYGAHSLRAGFITAAAAAGIAEHRIARHSRHRSIAVLRGYVRPGSIWLDHPGAGLL